MQKVVVLACSCLAASAQLSDDFGPATCQEDVPNETVSLLQMTFKPVQSCSTASCLPGCDTCGDNAEFVPSCGDCGDPSCQSCPATFTPAQAISWTPFPLHTPECAYRYSSDGSWNPYAAGGWCSTLQQDMANKDHSWDYFMNTYTAGATSAYSWLVEQDAAEDPCDKNYFVIHGCDGAGLQMGDCSGDTTYIEQFGPYTSDCGGHNGWVKPGDALPEDAHTPTFFKHPGTGYMYTWYFAGWWSVGGSSDPYHIIDPSKPWYKHMLGENKQLPEGGPGEGDADCVYAAIFPFITVKSDWHSNWGQEWAYKDGWPFGTADAMAYADNEPFCQGEPDCGHFGSMVQPRIWYAYKLCYKSGWDNMKGYLVAKKDPNDPKYHVKFQCQGNNGYQECGYHGAYVGKQLKNVWPKDQPPW